MTRRLALLILLFLSACASPTKDLDGTVVPIGNFRAGQLIARADAEMTKGPLSRDSDREEWITSLDKALKERFNRFEGGAYYHLGVTARAYILAKPGIPIIASPKSVLIFSVVVLEDSTGKMLTPKPHQITVVEQITTKSIFGSGYTLSKKQQILGLSRQAARLTENWLREQRWFEGPDTITFTEDDTDEG